jgi:hypothetical protein
MAILRGGTRIGGIDVRIGLPRDRSLDNVTGDARLKRTQGGNPESTMGRVLGYVNEAEGFARKARYYVEFFLPIGMPVSEDLTENAFVPSQEQNLRAIQNSNARRVQAFCSAIEMPDRTVVTKDVRHNGPARNIVYDFKSEDITATFYTDKFLRERSYFESWQGAAFSTSSFNYNYYKNYVSDIRIYQLGQFASRQERDDVTYAVQLYDCFPSNISKVEYSHDVNNIQTFNVTFKFRYWTNFLLNQGEVEIGQSNFGVPQIKEDGGILGGILGKLPPELRRAGRDALNTLKQRVPLGKISGGRAFPPFKLPPLNI